MIMTEEDQNEYRNAIYCHICGDVLSPPNDYCGVCEAKLGVNKDYCLSCGEKFIDKVRDHCHITGKYRGTAHRACNLKLRISGAGTYIDKKSVKVKNKRATMVPVVFHNLRGYDSHLIMQALSTAAEGQKIDCIPNNMEKYMTFSVGQLQFIDSLQFLNSSLDKLSSNLRLERLPVLTPTNSSYFTERVSTPTSTWTALRDSMKSIYHRKRPFTASYPARI